MVTIDFTEDEVKWLNSLLYGHVIDTYPTQGAPRRRMARGIVAKLNSSGVITANDLLNWLHRNSTVDKVWDAAELEDELDALRAERTMSS